MAASETRFSINWFYVAACLIAACLALSYISYSITARAYIELEHELPLSGGFSWLHVIVIDLACLFAFLTLLWKTWCDAQVKFGLEELSKPRLLKPRSTIKWSEVTDLKVFNGVGLHVYGRSEKIVVTPYAYSTPRKVIEFVTERAARRGANES